MPCGLFRDKQFGDKEIVQHSGMVTVKDKASALDALKKKSSTREKDPTHTTPIHIIIF